MRALANCEQYWELISASLDGALTPEEQRRLEAHLAGCPACRSLREELSGLEAELTELESPSEGFADAVMAAAAATEQDIPFTNLPQDRNAGREAQKRVRAWWKPIRNWCAIAACCLVALGLGTLLAQSGAFRAGNSANTAPGAEAQAAEAESPGAERAEDSAEPTGPQPAQEPSPEDAEADPARTESALPAQDAVSGDEKVRESLTVDGTAYQSAGVTVEELPEGFQRAGALTMKQAGLSGLAGCEYYRSPDEPGTLYLRVKGGASGGPEGAEWVYSRWESE